MLRSTLCPTKKIADNLSRLAHTAAAAPAGQASQKAVAGAGQPGEIVEAFADRLEAPRPAMTSQVRGVSLLDMATPASCMAARAIRAYNERLAARPLTSQGK